MAKIWSRLFRVYAHILISHGAELAAIDADKHVGGAYRHFLAFAREHRLVDDAALEPLRELNSAIDAAAAAAVVVGSGGGSGSARVPA